MGGVAYGLLVAAEGAGDGGMIAVVKRCGFLNDGSRQPIVAAMAELWRARLEHDGNEH